MDIKKFSKKVETARLACGYTQEELANAAGLTPRTIYTYETGTRFPRPSTLLRLAKALNVSSTYLMDDDCAEPQTQIERDPVYTQAAQEGGTAAVRDVEDLLDANRELFAGETLSQEEKDAFFNAIMSSYVLCKEISRDRYTPRSKKKQNND